MYRLRFIIDSDSNFPGQITDHVFDVNTIEELIEQAYPIYTQALNLIRSAKGLEAAVYLEQNPSPFLHIDGKKDGVPISVGELLNGFFARRVQQVNDTFRVHRPSCC